jgi:hypothetical protein
MAPETMAAATFEKYRRPDTRTIVNRKTLDVENNTFTFSFIHIYFTLLKV